MSRIGKKPIEVPAGVKVSITGTTIVVESGKQKLTQVFRPEIKVSWHESERSIVVTIDEKDKDDSQVKAYWGTTRALIRNMVEGVTKGYEEELEVVGVGWTAAVQGKALKLVVGFANPIMMDIPTGLDVTVEKQFVKVRGADKRMVGQFASEMRAKRKPEPYNGKGIKFKDEVIHRKQGKQFGA